MADRLKAGAKLIVVDPRRTATAESADLFLQIKPGTDLALLNGLLHLLWRTRQRCHRHEFIAEHTEGWDAMPAFLADYPPHRVAEITGLPEADIRTAARMIAEAGEWMSCWTMGLNQSTHGTWNTNAICNLHLATGAICRPGSGPFSLTGQPNAMGGREMGYMGPGLPGQRSVLSADDRAFVEDRWGLPPGTIRADVGPGTIDMFEQMADGDDQGLLDHLHQPVASVANRKTVIAGLEAAELVITQDAYRDTATNRYADIVLPAALWAESDGVMVNSERNLTLLQQSIPPAGQARPDWQLICQVAAHMGFGEHFAYQSSEEIFDEITRFWNPQTGYDLRGVSYERLRETPCSGRARPDDDATGTRSATSTTASARSCSSTRRPSAAAGVPDPVAARGVPRPAAHGAARTARRRLPVRAQHRPAAAPVAHDDQDRQGRQAQQAQPRAVRRDPSRRRRRARHRRRRTGRGGVAARPGGAARRRHRPGAAGQLLRAVPLERRVRRVPHDQRGDQRRRRPRLAAAGVQGVRGEPAAGEVGRHPAVD